MHGILAFVGNLAIGCFFVGAFVCISFYSLNACVMYEDKRWTSFTSAEFGAFFVVYVYLAIA